MAFKLPHPRELWSHGDQRIRGFGKAFFVVLVAFGILAARKALSTADVTSGAEHLQVAWDSAGLWWLAAWAVLTLAAACPWFMRPLYVAFTVVGMAIGFVIGHSALALMFFVLIVTIGRLRRASSPITRSFESGATSYWSSHRSPGSKARYYRQY